MSAVTDQVRRANPVPDEARFIEEWVGVDTLLRAAIDERKTDAVIEAGPARWRRGLVAAALAAAVVVLAIGVPALLRPDDGGPPAGSIPPPATTAPTSTVSPTSAPTTAVESQPTTTLAPAVPLDLEAAALDAIAGAGTMLVHAMPDESLWPLEPTDLLSAVERDLYLDLAPLPETRLQDGAVWIAALPDASQATLFISEATSGYREDNLWGPIAEFEVSGIDGAQGFVARNLGCRGRPCRSHATVWFHVDAVVAAVEIDFGLNSVNEEWPLDYTVHLAGWLHSSLSAQITGQPASGPDAPVAAPPSEYELEGVAFLEDFYRAIVSGDMDSAWALVGHIESLGPCSGEGCEADNWDMNVRAPLFAAMLDPFDATADIVGCSATSIRTVQLYPVDDGFRDGVDVRCLFQINGDPWLDALGINNLVETDSLVVPREPIVNLPSIPEHPGVESAEYRLLMFARHAGGSDPDTLAGICTFDPDNPDEQLAWSVDTDSPLRHLLEDTCWTYSGDFDDIAIPAVP